MRYTLLIFISILLFSATSIAVVPKIEGRFIELQDTYVSPIWTKINFQQQYDTPPAVFMLSTNQGGNPAIVRIRNVTTTGFEALPLEPTGEDGEHITMGAHYLAVEYGVHEFPDGTIMEVGSTDIQLEIQYGPKSNYVLPKSYQAINFDHPFAVRPNFFHSLQTINSLDSNPPTDALRPFLTIAVETNSLTTSGVNIALEASETSSGLINSEKVAYLVVEPGNNRTFVDDNQVEVLWESFFTGYNVDGWSNGCNYFNFSNNFATAPLVVASKNSRVGEDGGWLRSCNLTRKRLGIVVDEDRDGDNERSHPNEEASILAMTSTFVSNGDILSCDTLFPGAIATYNNGQIQLVQGVTVTDNNANVLTTTNYISTALTNIPLCNGQPCAAKGENALTAGQASQVPTVANDGSSGSAIPTTLGGDYFFDELQMTMIAPEYRVTAPTRIFLQNSTTLLSTSFLTVANTKITIENGAYLAIYVDGAVSIGAAVDFSAFLVATGEVRIAQEVNYTGMITSGTEIIAEESSSFTGTTVPNNIPGFCGINTPVLLDHYRLSMSDNKGLTCEAKELTLTACANDACDIIYDEVSTLDLSPDNNTQQSWVTGEVITFTGITDLQFAKRTTGQVQFGYNVADPSAPLRCYIGGTNVGLGGCKVTFSDAGFIFSNETNNNTSILNQISGKPSNTGFNASQLAIQAVKTNTTTGVCEAAFPAGGEVAIDLAYSCSAGSTCTNNLALTNNSTTHSIGQSYQTVPLKFDSDSKAPIVINYPDAGKLSLNAKLNLVLDPLTNLSVNLTGSSNEFVVKPFGLAMSFADTSAQANDASGSLFKLTGESFSIKMNAVQWLDNQDINNDGYPDDYSAISSNPIAKHFIGEQPDVQPSVYLPTAGVLGILQEENLVAFADTGSFSESISSYSYDQVGIIDLTAGLNDGDYFGAGDVRGAITRVGRFAPSQYTVQNIQASAQCTRYGSNGTYMNEPFTLGFTVQALNQNNQVMKNYIGGFINSAVSINAENSEVGNYISGSGLTPRLQNLETSLWGSTSALAGLFTISDNDTVLARRGFNDPDGPFESVNLMTTVTGIEGAVLLGADDNPTLATDCALSNSCNSVVLNDTPISFRFGRLVLGDNAGSDLDNLLVPMQAQYFNGSEFVLDTNNNCTSFEHPQITQVSPATPELSYIYGNEISGQLEQGVYPASNGIYAEPKGSGIFTLEYDTENWLEWDWQGDASQLNPQGILQFGRFRGNDRVIYWREVR
ncbi:DUF6701 domain-containing protein [Pseudoalteromonas sp. ZZD1]|uniref:DUF6701 domain-containing protein n=1 Tax=Pseudoalteromonas sp. ZZD1 TaxID=3139395 RepID=UPI003BAD3663